MKRPRWTGVLVALSMVALLAGPSLAAEKKSVPGKEAGAKKKPSGAGAAVLEWRLAKGQKQAFTEERRFKVSMGGAAGNPGPMGDAVMDLVLDTLYTVKAPAGAETVVERSVGRARLKMDMGKGQQSFEHDTRRKSQRGEEPPEAGSPEALGAALDAMVASPVTFTVDARGKVDRVEIPAPLVSALENLGPQSFLELEGAFTKEGMERMLREVVIPLPEKEVVAGAAWKDELLLIEDPQGTAKLERAFTLAEGKTPGRARIDLKLSYQLPSSAGDVIPDSETSKGSISFDSKAGRVLEAESTHAVKVQRELKMPGMGAGIQMQATMESTFRLKPRSAKS
jgi:hypothetical protein